MSTALTIVCPIYASLAGLTSIIDGSRISSLAPCWDIELLIVNDCSPILKPEEIYEILQGLNTMYKVTYFALEKNIGPGSARNFGLAKAAGEYIAFLDDDDSLLIERVQSLIKDNRNSVIMVSGTHYLADITGVRLFPAWLHQITWMLGFAKTVCWNKIYAKDFLINNKIYFSNLRLFEDEIFFIRLIRFLNKRITYEKMPIVTPNRRIDSRSRSFKSDKLLTYIHVQLEIAKELSGSRWLLILWIATFLPRSIISTLKSYLRSLYRRRAFKGHQKQ